MNVTAGSDLLQSTRARLQTTAGSARGNWRILLRLLAYVRPYRVRFALMLACAFLASATKIGGLVLIKPFGDLVMGTFTVTTYLGVPGLGSGIGRDAVEHFAATLEQSPHAALLLLVQALFVLVAVQSFSNMAAVYLQTYIGGRIGVDLKQQMLGRLLCQPLDYYGSFGKGLIHEIIDRDSSAVFRTLYVLFNRMIRGPVEVVSVLVIAIAIDWKLTLFAATLLPAIAVTIAAFRRRLAQQDANLMQVMGAGSGLLQEVLASPEVVKAYQMEGFFAERYRRVTRKLFRVTMSLRKSREWMGPVIDLTGGGATALFVLLNGRALIQGQIDLSSFILLYVCLGTLIEPLRRMGKGYGEIFLNFMSLQRVFHMLERTPEIHDRDDAVTLGRVAGRIEYRGVTFAYEPENPVLHNVSLAIAPGEQVALVGQSGAGKTTLANLLLRFYEPQEGAVFMDGRDVRDVTLESLRRNVGLVTQKTVLFTGTVRENIAAGRPDPSGEHVRRAARAAQAHDFIEALPDGYDTPLGDHGSNLSGGQAQRIAIARALFRDTPVLVMDEAMSSLDAIAEQDIQAAFLELTAGHTTIVIAHRMSTILNADRVILVHEGRVIAEGTHTGMLASNSLYRELFENQMLPLVDDLANAPVAADAGT